ncbi:transposase [Streptomyces sp900105245]|uniref:Transposase n=1 Tax=Streptomyces sp. 900105245 TaxID=3154379 RepID=A0ABV1UK88_9ACTN
MTAHNGERTPDLRRWTAPARSAKHQLSTDRNGTPLVSSLTSGNRHDITPVIPMLETLPHARGLRRRTHHRTSQLFADRSYDLDKYRHPASSRQHLAYRQTRRPPRIQRGKTC